MSRRSLPARSRAALTAGRIVAAASKVARIGSGSVIGGKLALKVDPGLLRRLTDGLDVALVSGTNGKTTTNHLLAAALATRGPVATNGLGANMPPGLVAALGDAKGPDIDGGEAGDRGSAALEVDERWLPAVLREVGPATVLLLNLSRDQLDRSHEVRKIADSWRGAFGSIPVKRVVANADDPLVVWAAGSAPEHSIVWVGTGLRWTADATGCPACSGRIEFSTGAGEPAGTPDGLDTDGQDTDGQDTDGRGGWHCNRCQFGRPVTSWSLAISPTGGADVIDPHGNHHPLSLSLPGRANAANATMVVAAAAAMGADPAEVLPALGTVSVVAGRYRVVTIAGVEVRMLLAKNPAGWQEAIDMLDPPPKPIVAAINARIADGRDPSWLWDVPYERLRGRLVVATGERRHDLAVRLRYAEVDHVIAGSLEAAVRAAGTGNVDLIANYTAFQDYLASVTPVGSVAPVEGGQGTTPEGAGNG